MVTAKKLSIFTNQYSGEFPYLDRYKDMPVQDGKKWQ
jgi:hypothetical protein